MVVLNMMDVAREQGKEIDCVAISEKLGVPVIGMSAADLGNYDAFYDGLSDVLQHPRTLNVNGLTELYELMPEKHYKKLTELLSKEGIDAYSVMWLAVKLMENDAAIRDKVREATDAETWQSIEADLDMIKKGGLITGNCKFRWVDMLLSESVKETKHFDQTQNRFDRIATSHRWGKLLAIGIILAGLVLSLVIALPLIKICAADAVLCRGSEFRLWTHRGSRIYGTHFVCV